MRTLIPAILVIGVMQTAIAAPPSYSKKEVDDKLSTLRKDLSEQFRQEVAKTQRPLTKEQIEATLGGSGYTKSEVNNALNQLRAIIPQQAVTQTQLDARLAKTDADAKDRERELRNAFESNLPKKAAWVAIGISIVSLATSAGTSIWTALQGRQLTLKNDKIDRSLKIEEEWRTGTGQKHADARQALQFPNISDNQIDTVTDVAGWLNNVAVQINMNLVDERITNIMHVKEAATSFWDALEPNTDTRLVQTKVGCGPIRELIGR